MKLRLTAALCSSLLLALSFPLTLPALPTWVLGSLPFDLPADPALGSFTIPGLPTDLGYLQFPALAFVALVPLLLAVRGARKPHEAFILGQVFGFVWLMLTLLWIMSFGIVPVLLLSLYFALPIGFFTWLTWNLMQLPASRNMHVVRLLWGVPLLWTALEYLRSFGLWAFPWNLLGYTLAPYPLLAQTADIGGVYSVSFLIMLVNALIVLLISSAGTFGLRVKHAALAVLLLAAASGYGWWRMQHLPPEGKGSPLTFELIQGGLSSKDAWSEERYQQSMDTYVGATRKALGLPPRASTYSASGSIKIEQPDPALVKPSAPVGDVLVVWPEGALLRAVDFGPAGDGVPFEVGQLVSDNPAHALLWGAIGYPPVPVPKVEPPPPVSEQAVQHANPPGTVAATPSAANTAGPSQIDIRNLSGTTQPITPFNPQPAPAVGLSDNVGSAMTLTKPNEMRTTRDKPAPQKPTSTKPARERNKQKKKAAIKPKPKPKLLVPPLPQLMNGCILTSRESSSWQYSKIRLVPYGEVTPFRGIVTILRFPWEFGRDLSVGREIKAIKWRGHSVGPLICFDNVFPFIANAEARAGAGYLVLMTNNSWYPMRSGIRQHGDLDVLRAIETRRPL
ncbi:MAG: hypothetical protein M3R04_02750, partial [bacterium]|nr:hypothetical protein [bacterium]